jgi:hypothetical protein
MVLMERSPVRKKAEERERRRFRALTQGDENMFGIIAAFLIVLWLLGSLAFHITSGFLYILLLLGVVSLAVYFISGSKANA